MKTHRRISVWLAIAFFCTLPYPAFARDQAQASGTGIAGLQTTQLNASYWIDKLAEPDRVVFDLDAIDAQNLRMQQSDPAWHNIEAFSDVLRGTQIKTWITARSQPPQQPLYDQAGNLISKADIARWTENLNLGAIPARQNTPYGLITGRASLRTFPTNTRVFSTQSDLDIDRFQEDALFPGTPVVIAHRSRDKAWSFVVANTYAAWVAADAVAQGTREDVFAYVRKTPYLVATGASVRTALTPEQPVVSTLALEMGVRVPRLIDWPMDRPVNGQHAHASYIVELPTRDANGALRLVPALVPRNADVAEDYLPLTQANILRQAFKFLGERYGWGHDYQARDCSGFVGEIYRSFGVLMPRNTSDQANSPALHGMHFAKVLFHAARVERLKQTRVGDMIHIPGHVMLVIGHEQGFPYVIHDTAGIYQRRDDDVVIRIPLNGVSITPLMSLLTEDGNFVVDRVTSIQRVWP